MKEFHFLIPTYQYNQIVTSNNNVEIKLSNSQKHCTSNDTLLMDEAVMMGTKNETHPFDIGDFNCSSPDLADVNGSASTYAIHNYLLLFYCFYLILKFKHANYPII